MLVNVAIHDASDAMLQERYVEVDQQANANIEQSEVSQQLSDVDGCKFLHAFQFNDHAVVDEKINHRTRV